MTQKKCLTLQDPKAYPHTEFGIPNSIYIGYALDTVFLELRPEVKVTVNQNQYATLRDSKVYPHTEFEMPTSNNIGGMLRTGFF